MIATINKLLNKSSEVIEKINKDRNNDKTEFNIFKIVGISTDEVKICKMLAELLNPNGSHKRTSLFFKSFISDVLGIIGVHKTDKQG